MQTMKLEGTIKSLRAANAVGMADVSQIVQFEVYGDHAWMELRGLMQKPLAIELTVKQMAFGEKSEGAVETTVVKRGRKKKEPKDLIPA
jgi:hypothetical protein